MNHSVRQEFQAAQSKENRQSVKQDPDRLRYHLMAPYGWLNDPNGLCQLDGLNHIFYQFTPGNPEGHDHRGWGHYTTRDFVHYKEENDPLVPDTEADGKGSYSGSAFVKDGVMHLFFTGNNKLPGDYDYINEGRIHYVVHTQSEDNGKTFTEKEVLLKNEDYPDDLSCHVRDPKILEDNGRYVMVLGARTKDSEGQAELFESHDLAHWKHLSTIRPEKPFGYMWECPDLFDLDGKRLLICCPQGVKQSEDYENLYLNGWFEIDRPLDHDQKVDHFHIFDHGFDFYAPQSYEDESGRRILIGWMAIPDVDYTSPTIERGWQHCLSLPRELRYADGKLIQYPIAEIEALRGKETVISLKAGQSVTFDSICMELHLEPEGNEWTLNLRKDARLSFKDGILTFSLGQSGYGRDARHVPAETVKSLDIFSDTSSLEIFVNKGEAAISTRLFDEETDFTLKSSTEVTGRAWHLNGFMIEENLEKTDPTLYGQKGFDKERNDG